MDIIRSLIFNLIAIYIRCLFKTWTYTNIAIILWEMISKHIIIFLVLPQSQMLWDH